MAQTKVHMNSREVMEMLALPPGDYLIVPSTFRPDETASFLLTILSKAETHIQYVPPPCTHPWGGHVTKLLKFNTTPACGCPQ